jgi:hypothetical protein
MRQAKDMGVIRETEGFRTALTKSNAFLKDYGRGALVMLKWDLNEEAIRDRMFIIKINDEEAVIDLEELLSYTRVM